VNEPSTQPAAPRVCIVIGKFHPEVGGGESHALALSRQLVTLGVGVTVLTRRTRSELPPKETIDGVRVVRVGPTGMPRWGKYAMLFTGMTALRSLQSDYDILYVCALRTLGLLGVRAAKRFGKTCVLRSECQGELSGDFIWKGPGEEASLVPRRPVMMYLHWRNSLLRAADRFLSIAGAITDEYRTCHVPEERIVEIPNGIDADRFTPVTAEQATELRRELNLPDGKLFVYSGKLNKGKGLEMLLRVWRDLIAEHPDVHLVLVGSGGGNVLSCEPALREQVARDGLVDRVTFTGFVHNVEQYLQAADCFVLPSDSEVLSIAILEALSCGLPVLSTRTGGTPEIITDGENGLLIDVKDEAALATGMRVLLDDPAAATAMGRRGRETVERHYSIASIAEKHLALFRELLA